MLHLMFLLANFSQLISVYCNIVTGGCIYHPPLLGASHHNKEGGETNGGIFLDAHTISKTTPNAR